MKYARVLALAALMSMGAAAAAEAQVSVGVRGGMNFSKFTGDDFSSADEKLENRSGFTGGLFLQVPLGLFTFQPEALFTEMGAEATGEDEDGEFTIEMKMQYLQIPLLARVNFAGMAGGVRPHLLVGPAVSFKLGCKLGGSQGGFSASVDCDEEFFGEPMLNVKSTDLGGIVGGGVGFGFGPGELSVDGRLYQGFTKIIDEKNEDGEKVDAKNRAWQVTAGFAFPLGR